MASGSTEEMKDLRLAGSPTDSIAAALRIAGIEFIE
jgi:hypothetical protein